ncbi:MAG: polymer-forming cytoskeletal protein [Pseudomonadota bacterium]
MDGQKAGLFPPQPPAQPQPTAQAKPTAATGGRDAMIGTDTIIEGEIQNGRRIDVFGYIEGKLSAEHVVVHPGGRVYGMLNAGQAEVHGTLQGEVTVTNLIRIGANGTVLGDVQYGQLAMEAGGNLSADVRNVPPELSGDFDLEVQRGRAVTITVRDLTAIDPDDDATDLTYSVTNARSGSIAYTSTPAQPITQFSQADLAAGRVMFVHDGSPANLGGFDVMVRDSKGATSGAPQHVEVAVR